VQPGWQFLTGNRADIDRIRRELGVYDPEDQQFEHMNVLTVGNEPVGDWFGIRALDRPDVIAYTVLRLTKRTTGSTGGQPAATSSFPVVPGV
jgi:protein SCO1/2